ncbi:IS3 family transposase [Sinanaerobacter chloroacetimidivorans]|uniref:IS3 family transposase n=1 Tax=Sinanaerobacter chloroacetimidivorans TaxID=2818044 RepID=A0A8J7W7H8_9FIRM|nr:IS3 family transposase [Sinanaerobacter chloroacetimidivorans]
MTADEYVNYNNQRPAYALKYQSPVQYQTKRGFG